MSRTIVPRIFLCVVAWILLTRTGIGQLHHIHVYTVDQEIVGEPGMDIGTTFPGEKRTVQFYVTNHTLNDLSIDSVLPSLTEWKLTSPARIPALEGGLISGTIEVGKSSRDLDRPIRVGFQLGKNCRLATALTHKSSEFATLQDELTTIVVHESRLQSNEPMTVEIPLTLSEDQQVEKLSVSVEPSLSLLTVKPRTSKGKPILEVSFFPKTIDRSSLVGKISILNAQKSGVSQGTLRIRVRRDIDIFPETVVFRKAPGTFDYVGEALLHCDKPSIRVEDVTLQGELSSTAKVTCEVKKMGEKTGRVYLRISPQEDTTKSPHKEIILIQLSDGQVDRELFVTCFVPQ